MVGYSHGSWEAPIHPYSEDDDAFVAKVESNGNLGWNTFLGSVENDYAYGVKLGANDTIFVTGAAFGDFGSAIDSTNGEDAFVVKLGPAMLYLPMVVK